MYVVYLLKQKTADERRMSDWSSDGCSSDLQIVLDVPAGGLEVAVALLLDGVEALVEGVEFELGADLDRVAHVARPGELALEDGARRVRQLLAVLVEAVAHHQRRPLQPGNAAQRIQIGAHLEVAIALVPGDRKSVVQGKSVSVRVALGGSLIIKKQNKQHQRNNCT